MSLGWTLIQQDCYLHKRENCTQKQTQRENNVKTQGECHLKAKECPRPPEARGEAWDGTSLTALGRSQHCQHFDLETTSLQNCETIHFCCLSHPVCDSLLPQSQKTLTFTVSLVLWVCFGDGVTEWMSSAVEFLVLSLGCAVLIQWARKTSQSIQEQRVKYTEPPCDIQGQHLW